MRREQARVHEAELTSAMAQLDELEAECRRQREAEADAVKASTVVGFGHFMSQN